MNKQSLSRAIVIMSLFIATACSKTPEKPVTPEPAPVARISKITYDNNLVEATYYSDGRINKLTSKDTGGTQQQVYTFVYQNGKLDEVQFGVKWKYTYTNDRITRVQSINEAGVVKYQTEFMYNGSKVSEKIESRVNGNSIFPSIRTTYEYNTAGNISKKIDYIFINQNWKKSEEVLYPEYDTHPNTTQQFENYPYMPGDLFCVNNPLKEVFVDESGPVTGTVTHAYTYDSAGRPITRKTIYKYPGLPDEVENTKLFY